MNFKELIARLPKLEQINSTYGTRYYRLPSGNLAVSCTTALKTLNKENLLYWAAGEQKKCDVAAAEAAFVELTRTGYKPSLEAFRSLMSIKMGQEKAHQRIADAAKTIGVEAHRVIEHRLRKRLGQAMGEEPRIGDASMVAVLKFESWSREVGFEILASEFQVWDEANHWAGTADFLARLGDGRVVLGDWKVSSGLYVESTIQSAAYRRGLAGLLGLKEPLGGIVVRLPKSIDKPEIEIKELSPATLEKDFTAFRACLWLWKYLHNFDPKMEVPAPRAKKTPAAPVPMAPLIKRWTPKIPIPVTGAFARPLQKPAGR